MISAVGVGHLTSCRPVLGGFRIGLPSRALRARTTAGNAVVGRSHAQTQVKPVVPVDCPLWGV